MWCGELLQIEFAHGKLDDNKTLFSILGQNTGQEAAEGRKDAAVLMVLLFCALGISLRGRKERLEGGRGCGGRSIGLLAHVWAEQEAGGTESRT